MHKAKTPYGILLSQARVALVEGQQAIEEAKVHTYWQTGQYIHKYILKYSDRAEYGGEVVKLLARDLSLEDSTLYACVKFAKLYPKPPRPLFKAILRKPPGSSCAVAGMINLGDTWPISFYRCYLTLGKCR